MPDFRFGVARQICEATMFKLATAQAHYKCVAGLFLQRQTIPRHCTAKSAHTVVTRRIQTIYAFTAGRPIRFAVAGDSHVVVVCTADRRSRTGGSGRHRDSAAAMTVEFVGGVLMKNRSMLQGPVDPLRIDVGTPDDVRHWAREIGRPADQIRQAVLAVGPLVADVRDFLRRRSLYRLGR